MTWGCQNYRSEQSTRTRYAICLAPRRLLDRERPLIATLTGPHKGVYSVTFSPNGKIIAAGDWYGTIFLWSTSGHSRVGILSGPSPVVVWSIAFSPDGKAIAAGYDSGSTSLWRISGSR